MTRREGFMNTNAIQAMMDGMSAAWQRERSTTQMTLGSLIERLETLPPETMVDGIRYPHSYRGYYSDLAFEMGDKIKAADALALCRSAMGEVFRGWKGGEYQMGRNTPLWVASEGCCGNRIMALRDDGTLETAPED
jgi:hypothetical protein